MAPREDYQLYRLFCETAIPLPEGPLPERLPFDGLARLTPCDGCSETPQVPASLPRPLPNGTYRWGAYVDEATLTVALDTTEGPTIPALADRAQALEQLIIFQPEGRWHRTLQISLNGELQAPTAPYQHGPRRAVCDEPEWGWSAERHSIAPKRWRTIWRISLAAIRPHLRGGKLRLSLSRTSLRDHESVAWGAHGIWGPRFDECGTVVLEPSNEEPLSPVLRSLEMTHEPTQNAGTLRFQWENGYREEEAIPANRMERSRLQRWDQFSARVNGQLAMASFEQEGVALSFPLRDGFNEIHIATRGGTAARLFLERSRDDKLTHTLPEALFMRVNPSDFQISERVATELAHLLPEGGPPVSSYYSRACSFGSTLAIFHKHAPLAAHVRAWLDSLGETTLKLQREDGSFSGFHLSPEGRSHTPWQGGAYDTGQAGEFWIRAWQATGEDRYLLASERLVRAYEEYRVEFNPNYAAFALFHLAPHYQLTGDALALKQIGYYLEHCILPDILPLGYHGGHNYYTVYASIILRAMGLAASVIPADHPLVPRLQRLIRRMINQTLTRLQPDGTLDSRDRHFIGETQWGDGLFGVAELFSGDDRTALDQALAFILSGAFAAPAAPTREEPFLDPLPLMLRPAFAGWYTARTRV